jgi:predicted  nucleic acid-binding Zn-ribbon protein
MILYFLFIFSQSTIEDYEKQMNQLQQKLSQNEDERSLLRERLNEIELEFRKTLDDNTSTLSMYEEQLQSAVQERNALVEQQALQSAEK